jgi:HK97 gp10 family phage protein
MPMPKSVTKVDSKGNVTYISSVDKVQYTLNELCRAALKDCAKMIRKKMIVKLKKLPGVGKTRRVYRVTQIWVRKKEADLQIGFGNTKKGLTGETWYGILQELGSKNQPKRSILRDTVYENVQEIRNIQAQYLSAIKDESKANSVIDESELTSEDVSE